MSLLLARRRPLLFPSAAAAAGYAAEVLADSPYAYWRFEETSGSTAADEVGTNDGTVYGADLNVSGLAATGSAASFDGTDDYIDFGTGPHGSLDGTSLTVETLCKSNGLLAGEHTALSIEPPAMPGSWTRSFIFRIENGLPKFIKIPNGVDEVVSAVRVDDGEWHHLAATYDGTTLRLFVDGAEVDSTPATGSTLGTDTAPLQAGRNNRTTGVNYFNGTIDEPAVYTTVLSAARILVHAQAAGVA